MRLGRRRPSHSGVVHALTFRFDANLPFMLAIDLLFAYEGGAVQPGDGLLALAAGTDYPLPAVVGE